MNTQYSRVGRTYPKMDSNVIDTKSTRERTLFFNNVENNSIQAPIDSRVIRLKTK